ncbi:MAG: c-type cytochrome [Pseudomonadota bacterium]|nr:c-type cytochrome [Pseudomonadota bacterium]
MRDRGLMIFAILAGFLLCGSATASDPRNPSMLGNTCAGCHGTNGASGGGAMPNIGGLDKLYLQEVLKQFKSGARDSTIMGRIMRGYSDLEINAIASFMARQEWVPASFSENSGQIAEGGKIHASSQCDTCHKNDGRFQNDYTPRLAGQWPEYLYNMLAIFHDIGSPASQPAEMRKRVQKLSQEEIEAVANFYAAQR